jgi:YjbE family integral membrane protein
MMTGAADAIRLLEIAGVNILLSGDNAIIVAMAIRNLPSAQRETASAAGIGLAILAEAAVTLTVAWLLGFAPVTFIGGILLAVIAIGLTRNNRGESPDVIAHHEAGKSLLRAIVEVAGAYLVGCVDNILGVAAVGRGDAWLLVLGLTLSGAVLVPASVAIAALMRRFPLILKLGAAILGWTAGSMMTAAVARLFHKLRSSTSQLLIPALMTILVVTSPLWWRPSPGVRSPADSPDFGH